MARNGKNANGKASVEKAGPQKDRLKLIKKRHWELILRPREQLLGSFSPEDDEQCHPLDEAEEMQLLQDYSLEA